MVYTAVLCAVSPAARVLETLNLEIALGDDECYSQRPKERRSSDFVVDFISLLLRVAGPVA